MFSIAEGKSNGFGSAGYINDDKIFILFVDLMGCSFNTKYPLLNFHIFYIIQAKSFHIRLENHFKFKFKFFFDLDSIFT